MTKEAFNSFTEWLKFRSTTSLLGTFAGFYATYHWQAIYVTLFVSEKNIEQKFHMLKNEYVNHYFLGWHGLYDWNFYFGIAVPAFLTWAFIWVLPDLLFLDAFNHERDYKLKRKIRIAQDEHALLLEREKSAKSTKRIAETELDVAKTESKIVQLDPAKQYDQDYKKFTDQYHNSSQILESIKEAYYGHDGHYHGYNDSGVWTEPGITSEEIAIGDTNGLLTIADNRIHLTEKGRHFIAQGLANSLPF